VLLALVCACGGPQARLLFDRVSTPNLGTPQDIVLDLGAIDTDQFRVGIGQRTLVPRQLIRRRLPNGSLVTGTFAGGGSLILARVGQTMTGVIRLGGTGFEIQPVPGGHKLIPRSWKDPRPIHGPNWDDVVAKRGPKPPPKLPSNEPVEITVQFAYTARVLEQRGLNGIRGHIATAMTQMETACKTAKVKLRFSATKEPVKTTGTEGEPPNKKSIYMLWDDLYQRKDFLDAHAARETAHADILVLLVDSVEGGLGLATVMASAETAVAVVDHHDSLFTLTIPHEIGHILGGIHEDDGSDAPYAWGHGFVGIGGRTIMSNPCDDETKCILLEEWSSVAKHGDAHDVARVLRETGPVVAEYGDKL
jgi:hypothetical protein